jgi:sugar O-acyltransferase (sialic acid O-acetyltransferase NeuD family)
MRILVLGAGGHGQVVADILLRMEEAGARLTVAGYLDDDPRLQGKEILGLPVVGVVTDLTSVPHDGVVIGIGSNAARSRLVTELARHNERFVTACHPKTVVAPDVVLGSGSVVCGGVVISTGSSIGQHVILNTGCTVDHHNQIRDFAHIAPGVHLGGNVRIGMGSLVGIGATVLPGREVADWAVVGAGSVVNRSVPSGATVMGIPATIR